MFFMLFPLEHKISSLKHWIYYFKGYMKYAIPNQYRTVIDFITFRKLILSCNIA